MYFWVAKDSHKDKDSKISRIKRFKHLAWYSRNIADARDSGALEHVGSDVYLDWAGAALFSKDQAKAAHARLLEGLLANPHTSQATEESIGNVRRQILGMFGASSEAYSVVFTSGATQGLQLIGENFAWDPQGIFLYATESHTSVVGLRQFARAAGTACGTFSLEDLSSLQHSLKKSQLLKGDGSEVGLPSIPGPGQNLIAFPGESNFSGVLSDLSCIGSLRDGPWRWRVLLDAAKLASSPGALDLSRCPADFVVISFYKIFGLPTGLGAMLVRHDAAPLLAPKPDCTMAHGTVSYFAGGTVASISATSTFVVPRPSLVEWLERGTPNFQSIAMLPSQLEELSKLGSANARRLHCLAVVREAYLGLTALQHSSSRPVCTVFGNHARADWYTCQGPIISFLVHYKDGSLVSFALVDELARMQGILLRVGCVCSVGSCQTHLDLSDADVKRFFAEGKVCGDNKGIVDGKATGIVRASFGTYSNISDARRLVNFLRAEFLNRSPQEETESQCTVGVPGFFPTTNVMSSKPIEYGKLVNLKVYPIKGCGALEVERWPLAPGTGVLWLDRRWCFVQGHRKRPLRPLNVKGRPELARIKIDLCNLDHGACVCLSVDNSDVSPFLLPLDSNEVGVIAQTSARVVSHRHKQGIVEAFPGSLSEWFFETFRVPDVRLESTGGDDAAGPAGDFMNVSGTALLISLDSLQHFRERCGMETIEAERFRANFEVTMDPPLIETSWSRGKRIRIGSSLEFEVAKACVRCQAIDVTPNGTDRQPVLSALATVQRSDSGGGTPTFGVLLKSTGMTPSRCPNEILEVGSSLFL